MQLHGEVLQLKAFITALDEAQQYGPAMTQLPGLLTIAQLAEETSCPAIAAECLEVGRMVLQIVGKEFSARPLEGTDCTNETGTERQAAHEEAARFMCNFKSACSGVLRLQRDKTSMNGTSGGSSLEKLAMQPVLIESGVWGMLEASSGLDELLSEHAPISSTAGKRLPESKSFEAYVASEEGLSRGDLQIIFAGSEEVHRAGLKAIQQMLISGSTSILARPAQLVLQIALQATAAYTSCRCQR